MRMFNIDEKALKNSHEVVLRFNMLMDVLIDLLKDGELSRKAAKRIDKVIKAQFDLRIKK